MPEAVFRTFQDELESLGTVLAQMGGLVEAQLAGAIDAIARRDQQIAEQTIKNDLKVDQLQVLVEQRCVRILGARQPQPDELRETLSAIKIAADLERVGDLAKNIGKRAAVLSGDAPQKHLIQGLARMGRQAQLQLKSSLDAYSRRDAAAAIQVWRNDGEIDELYNSLFRELLTYMMEDPRKISISTHLLFIAKNFERVGDHATNIAETVHYLINGASIGEERPKSDITSITHIPFEQKP